ncbi:MAG: thiamine diphosphokinase [Lachnospiraceae bacterium]|nr:thiamine diphosphokinase [Lachnospiraceae bacterium]
MARCIIVGNADISSYERVKEAWQREESDYIIICDGGLKHVEGLNLTPNLLVGDFDSHENPHWPVETIELPRQKDDTDTVYALKEGIRRGFREFICLGVIGNRLDHSLGNLYMLLYMKNHGCSGILIDDYSVMRLVGREEVSIPDSYAYFSLLNITGCAKGITIQGAKYPLLDGEISSEYQYGISNEVLLGESAKVSVKEGELLLIQVFPEVEGTNY